jgi:hypothetical protein
MSEILEIERRTIEQINSSRINFSSESDLQKMEKKRRQTHYNASPMDALSQRHQALEKNKKTTAAEIRFKINFSKTKNEGNKNEHNDSRIISS